MLERLKRHAKVIGGAVALWFILLLSGGLFLSQIDARDGLNVFGPEVWVAGEPAALRVARRDLRFNRLMPLSKLNARFISPSGEVGPAVALEGRANGFVQGLLTPPSRAGRWKIALTGEIEDGPITAELGVDVLPSPPLTPIEPLSKQPPVYPPDVGALRVALTPMGPLLAAGLPDSLALRITDAQGQPRRALVEFGLKEGASAIPLPRRLLTGAHGLARMNIHPLHPRFWFTFTVLDPEAPLSAPSSQPTSAPSSQPTSAPSSQPTSAPSSQPSSQPAWIWASGERRISHTPTQFALTTSRLIVAPGDTLALRVQSIHRQGGVFIDAWHGARWLATSALTLAEGSGVARLTVPDPGQDPALLWVQAYQTTYLPGRSRGGQYVLVSRKSPLEALDWLRAMLIKDPQAPPSLDALPRSDDPLLVEYLLGRIERPQRDPPLLADSGVSAKQTVALLKSTWQRRFAVGLLSSGAVLLLGLFFLVYYNTRQVTQGWAAAGGDEEGDKGTRKHALLDAAYILIILALFLFGLVQLLLSIHW